MNILKGWITTFMLTTVLTVSGLVGPVNAAIIVGGRDLPPCTTQSTKEKIDSAIIVGGIVAIIVGGLTGTILTPSTDSAANECAIIVGG